MGRLLEPTAIAFPLMATHMHAVLDHEGRVYKQTARVIQPRAEAHPDDLLGLAGVLNSSAAAFWLRQNCYNKGGGGSEPWEARFEFAGSVVSKLPLPKRLPVATARLLETLANQGAVVSPDRALGARRVAVSDLRHLRDEWFAVRYRSIFQQEELDWEVYRLYGLVDEDLTYSGGDIEQLVLGERAFEIALARSIADAPEETAWFERHGSTPITQIPDEWSASYRELVQKRLDVIATDPFIGLLERPEYKRRWNSPTFDDLLPESLRDFILDKVEEASLWSDASGPAVLSVAQLADRVRGDVDLVEAMRLLRDAVEVDLTKELGKLLADEAVPYLAALRYKDSGMRKRAEWESVWDLQRREDAGESVSIPVPPKYGSGDFRKTSYWKARGKLDVPKERFITYPGAERPGDSSMVIGWAGWDHLDQARALARLIVERTQGEGMSPQQVLPLVAGLVELEPWLHQWHADPDAAFGGMSPATFITGFIHSQLAALGATRTDAKAWRP